MKTIFVSRLNPKTTVDDVLKFLTDSKIINDTTDVHCVRLVPKDKDTSELSFVSFKLAVPKDLYDIILDPNIWPGQVALREFVDNPPRPRQVAVLTSNKRTIKDAGNKEAEPELNKKQCVGREKVQAQTQNATENTTVIDKNVLLGIQAQSSITAALDKFRQEQTPQTEQSMPTEQSVPTYDITADDDSDSNEKNE